MFCIRPLNLQPLEHGKVYEYSREKEKERKREREREKEREKERVSREQESKSKQERDISREMFLAIHAQMFQTEEAVPVHRPRRAQLWRHNTARSASRVCLKDEGDSGQPQGGDSQRFRDGASRMAWHRRVQYTAYPSY